MFVYLEDQSKEDTIAQLPNKQAASIIEFWACTPYQMSKGEMFLLMEPRLFHPDCLLDM